LAPRAGPRSAAPYTPRVTLDRPARSAVRAAPGPRAVGTGRCQGATVDTAYSGRRGALPAGGTGDQWHMGLHAVRRLAGAPGGQNSAPAQARAERARRTPSRLGGRSNLGLGSARRDASLMPTRPARTLFQVPSHPTGP